ncbi:MAG: hypothetical protein JWM41_2872 [Gemmatimonadetes bacterium]|nr:hypothetical protein [Gemmatimonadota bacterium]
MSASALPAKAPRLTCAQCGLTAPERRVRLRENQQEEQLAKQQAATS